MKKSEAAEKFAVLIRRSLRNEGVSEDKIQNVLIELPTDSVSLAVEIGMLPPTSTCILVDDPMRPGCQKHSESKREWDNE